jgi:hypothetical protein
MPDRTDKAVSADSGIVATTGGVMTGLGLKSLGIAPTSTAAGIGNVVAGSSFGVAKSWRSSRYF